MKTTRIPAVNPESVRPRPLISMAGLDKVAPKEKKHPLTRHPNGCITKRGGRLETYSFIQVGEHSIGAHRVVFALAHGQQILHGKSLHVHHKCGNPGCLNPDHLMLLTNRDHRMAHARHNLMVAYAKRAGMKIPFIEPLSPDCDLTPKTDSA